jgi:1,4-alpha-glucan branching enzyme
MRRLSLNLLLLVVFLLSIAGCSQKRLGPEITKGGILFTFYSPTAKRAAISGSFNAWDFHKDRMSGPDKSGVWRDVIPLPEGRYEYLFDVNGKEWQPDPSVPAVDDGFGGKNSVLFVPEEHAGL